MLTGSRVILTNPRYTGQQVWNKQRTDEVLLDVNDVTLGHTAVMRRNTPDRWITSKNLAHEPLIDMQTLEQARQLITGRARTATSPRRTNRSRHAYIFRSRVYCGVCERKMQGQYSHGVAYYRCRYPQEYAIANKIEHPQNVYLREDALITPLDTWLAQEFGPLQRRHTTAKLVDQAGVGSPVSKPAEPTGSAVAQCDAELARYRQALEAGADPAVVAGWIAETQAERQHAVERAARPVDEPAPPQLTKEELIAIVEEAGDMTRVLRADPDLKSDVYNSLGLHLTYDPETQTVRARVDLATHRGVRVGVRGGT